MTSPLWGITLLAIVLSLQRTSNFDMRCFLFYKTQYVDQTVCRWFQTHKPSFDSIVTRSGVQYLSKYSPPHCVAESDQRHAQHPMKMLGIDFPCGSYQTNSERIMVLNSGSNWHVFIFYPLPFCRIENRWAEMTAINFAQGYVISRFPADAIGSPGNHAHLHRRREAQKCE